ncbi:MAG TPA: flagellar hook-length control protein FliK, partial [Planctomycetota bacterium]|nr:flagellar hook-length control protein FliK [Planctomycetota bacterium]
MDLFPLRPNAIQPVQGAAQLSRERLAEARLVAAEVLQVGDGGSIVLGVGRERIAATSQAALQVGQKVWLQLRGSSGARALSVLDEEALDLSGALVLPEPGPEAEHPLRWLARARGWGELLGDLETALTARGARTPKQANELAARLAELALVPGESGEILARKIRASGLGHEAAALAEALDELPEPALHSAARDVVRAAFGALGSDEEAVALRRSLAERLTALAHGAGELHPPATESRASFALRTWLAAAMEEASGAGERARAEVVERLLVARRSPRLARAVLAVLLGEPSALPHALQEDGGPLERALPDLKQRLLEAARALEPGPERQALHAALEAVEAEQRIAVTRLDRGDGSSFSFALRDGSGFTDARLVHRRHDAEDGDATRPPRKLERAVLGFEFSSSGPVRADFCLDGDTLHVRLAVARADVAERLDARLGVLRERLAAGGRVVRL